MLRPGAGEDVLAHRRSVAGRGGDVGIDAFDVIVIGAGPAGEVAAADLAAQGRSVAVVEAALVGGECAFYACMPSKALLRPAEVLAEARRVPGAAQAITGSLDVAATLARRDEVIHSLDDASKVSWLDEHAITLIRGHGRLAGERCVTVGEQRYEARSAVVVAVGSAAAIPPIRGLADSRPWTNREVTTAREVPASLVVLGGGAVGVEMAQAYSELGASVTIVEARDRLVPGEEAFVAEQLGAAFRERGIDIRLGVRAESVDRTGGIVRVELSDGQVLEASEILVAVGRRPLTDDLGLESVGLRAGEIIEVDDTLRVPGLPWLFAVGDVNGRALLTHMATYQARVAAQVIAGQEARATRDDNGAPHVIFTDPQVAAVGLTLQGALDSGVNARAYDVATSDTAGASFHGRNTPGTSRLVVDEDRSVIIGATFTGTEVAEWLQAATIAVVGEIPMALLREAVPAFPTRSEVWLRLLERWIRQSRSRSSDTGGGLERRPDSQQSWGAG
jgi:pyruvate/2-oxoglutarate dehydrogenase complex dihydrolipoamide dehydrogenase (E3) component